MGVAGSVDKADDANYAAFMAITTQYEGEYKSKLASGEMTEEQVLIEFRSRFVDMVGDPKLAAQLENVNMNCTDALSALLNDERTLAARGLRVGDVVKVKDEGFYVEGVVIAVHGVRCLVDFGVDIVDGHADDEYSGEADASLGPSVDSADAATAAAETEAEAGYDPFDSQDNLEESEEPVVPRKTFPCSECLLIMSGEEFEICDKVEVRLQGTFLYAIGYIYKVHRKFNAKESCVDVTYDVCMEGTDGEAIAMRNGNSMEDRVTHYEECLAQKHTSAVHAAELEGLDMELDVAKSVMRKIMSGRIKAAERWKSAWRKVTAMIAFKRAGAGSLAIGALAGAAVRVGAQPSTPDPEQVVHAEHTPK